MHICICPCQISAAADVATSDIAYQCCLPRPNNIKMSWLDCHCSYISGLALTRDTHQDTAPYMVLERPKVLFDCLTNAFVMWMHIDDADYKQARLGVAVSKSPIGPFTFERSFRPHGQESRDFTVWKVRHSLLASLCHQALYVLVSIKPCCEYLVCGEPCKSMSQQV